MEGVKLCSVIVSAPGKVILHGEHSVVYGKTAIASSLGLRSNVHLQEHCRNPDKPAATLHFPLIDLKCELDLRSLKQHLFNVPSLKASKITIDEPEIVDHMAFVKRIDNFLIAHGGKFQDLQPNQKNALRSFVYVYAAFAGIYNLELRSFDLIVRSDLTIGSGMGSSASFSVCLAGAVFKLVEMRISNAAGGEFTREQQGLISQWAFNCERIMHGNPSGVDNAVCAFGSYVIFKKQEKPQLLKIPLNLRILLVNTKVPRETKTLVAKVSNLRSRNQAAIDYILDACDSVSVKAQEIMTTLSKYNGAREINLIDERFKDLEELWDMNHCLLSALGVSHRKLEEIRQKASEYGFACKLTGAGGGGYAIVLVPPSADVNMVNRLREDLLKNGFEVKETELAGDGVTLISTTTSSH